MAEFSVQAEIKVLAVNILIWSSKSSSKFISVFGRINSLSAIGLRSHLLRITWELLATPGDHSQVHRGCIQGKKYASLADSRFPGLHSIEFPFRG